MTISVMKNLIGLSRNASMNEIDYWELLITRRRNDLAATTGKAMTKKENRRQVTSINSFIGSS